MSCWISSSRLQIDLDRAIHLLCDLDGQHCAVRLKTPAETSTQEVVVNPDRLLGEPGNAGKRPSGSMLGTCVPTQISQLSFCICTVQFIGSIVAWARNGT